MLAIYDVQESGAIETDSNIVLATNPDRKRFASRKQVTTSCFTNISNLILIKIKKILFNVYLQAVDPEIKPWPQGVL